MPSEKNQSETPRSWVTGLIVMVAVAVSYIGFARVSVEWTLGISTIIFVSLVVFLWRAGSRKQRDGGRGR